MATTSATNRSVVKVMPGGTQHDPARKCQSMLVISVSCISRHLVQDTQASAACSWLMQRVFFGKACRHRCFSFGDLQLLLTQRPRCVLRMLLDRTLDRLGVPLHKVIYLINMKNVIIAIAIRRRRRRTILIMMRVRGLLAGAVGKRCLRLLPRCQHLEVCCAQGSAQV